MEMGEIEEIIDLRKESEELLNKVQEYVKKVNELHKEVMKSKFLKLTFNIKPKPGEIEITAQDLINSIGGEKNVKR
jgi:ribosomal protein L29